MPPPDEPHIPSATAGLSAQDAAAADKDYLYFLRHVHLDGDAYSLVIPSKDGDSAPPQVVRYEQPLPDHNAGSPVAGSECGGQKAPPQSEGNSGATSEAQHGVKRRAPDASPGGEERSGAVPMEEDTPTPVAETAFELQPGIDEDYLFFLKHARVVNDKLVLKAPGYPKITIGDKSDPEENDDTEEEEEEEEGEESDGVDGLASGQSGEDGIGMEEKDDEEEAIPASDTEHGVDSDSPILKERVLLKEVKEEEVSNKEGEDDDVDSGGDLQIVNDPVYYETKKVKVEVEEPLNALVSGTTDLDPSDKKEASSSKGHLATPLDALTKVKEEVEEPLNALISGTTDLDPSHKMKGSSSKRHLAMPLNVSELQGIIWPPHINERPNSVFKEKLIEFLKKPFAQEEYDRYLFLATDHTPMVKERRTRNKVAYYTWTHEMGKSYFDRYPDLAEQFSLQSNNYPNGLALLRGLFFWLQNMVLEGQFRPWSNEFKRYRVVPFMEVQ